MKILSGILAVLFLALSFMPCDDVGCDDHDETEIHAAAEVGDHFSDHTDADNCSPFCMCQCCQKQVIPFKISFEQTKNIQRFSFTPISDKNLKDRASCFWRPPRV
jgi:hypothetical protein